MYFSLLILVIGQFIGYIQCLECLNGTPTLYNIGIIHILCTYQFVSYSENYLVHEICLRFYIIYISDFDGEHKEQKLLQCKYTEL